MTNDFSTCSEESFSVFYKIKVRFGGYSQTLNTGLLTASCKSLNINIQYVLILRLGEKNPKPTMNQNTNAVLY